MWHCVPVSNCVFPCVRGQMVCDTTGVGIKGCLSLCSGPNGVWHFVPVSSCNCVFPCVRGQMVCDTTGVGIKGCLALCWGQMVCGTLCRCQVAIVSSPVFGAKWCVTLQVLVSRGVWHCVWGQIVCCTVC